MTMKRATLIVFALSSLVGCSGMQQPDRSLLALNRSAVVTSPDRQEPTVRVERVPEAVLRDPTERLLLMARLRRQIADRTRQIPEARFREVVRPQLAENLRQAGFTPVDAEDILAQVDESRR
jgi:hypothetical protein